MKGLSKSSALEIDPIIDIFMAPTTLYDPFIKEKNRFKHGSVNNVKFCNISFYFALNWKDQ